MIYGIVAGAIILIVDQIIKFLIVNNLFEQSINIIPNFLSLTYTENTGGAFGVGNGNIAMFIITNLIVLGLLTFYLIKNKNEIKLKYTIPILVIIFAGLGNFIDRIARGFVVDYLDITPLFRFPVFNFADMCIVISCIVLAIFILTNKEEK